jgi:hypothetical protein
VLKVEAGIFDGELQKRRLLVDPLKAPRPRVKLHLIEDAAQARL